MTACHGPALGTSYSELCLKCVNIGSIPHIPHNRSTQPLEKATSQRGVTVLPCWTSGSESGS
eukprot:6665973-Alexandrium_andersonii.AAC.1